MRCSLTFRGKGHRSARRLAEPPRADTDAPEVLRRLSGLFLWGCVAIPVTVCGQNAEGNPSVWRQSRMGSPSTIWFGLQSTLAAVRGR